MGLPPYLCFDREICKSTVETLLTKLRSANSTNRVYVSSPGGTFDFFSVLGPAIQRQGIVTLSGDVRSAAVVLFLLGHVRQALPDATFFFHEVRTFVGQGNQITVADLEHAEEYERMMSAEGQEAYQEWRQSMKMAQAWFARFISTQTGLPASTFLNLMRAEATLSAREAVRYGIVHEIVPARLVWK